MNATPGFSRVAERGCGDFRFAAVAIWIKMKGTQMWKCENEWTPRFSRGAAIRCGDFRIAVKSQNPGVAFISTSAH